MDAPKCALLLSLSCLLLPVQPKPMCDVVAGIEKDRKRCLSQIKYENVTSGCNGTWDVITCWPSARIGDVVTVPCPDYFSSLNIMIKGNLSKTCTSEGWTKLWPINYAQNCGYNLNGSIGETEGYFFWSVKTGYTIGHSVSLISLTAAIIILCIFRKLHCTRNYIHMHLFVSFILKALAVFIKDVVLYEVGESDNCFSESEDGHVLADNSTAAREGEHVAAGMAEYEYSQVQAEIKRKWRRWHMERFLGADMKSQQPSMGSNGNNFSTQMTMLTKCSPMTRRASACLDNSSVL
ncbi:vasoactive intestinal polypeptide receptor-like isoform X1 [Arapaima gigas]